jgi:hypothetical protein
VTDPGADDVIQEVHPARGIMFDLRDNGWTGWLVLYLRAMACVSMMQGLYYWAEVCGIIGEEGGFEAHIQSWQATTAFFAVIDLVAAVGLWLVAPWGAVVWLTATVSLIVVNLFFDQVFGTDMALVSVGMLMIAAYLALAVLAAREHPR